MARRFARVDLSERARDYRPSAIEPGVPLLDSSNTNAKILFKWLGGLAAEPEWEGESVNFYVRDDHGGRLEDVACQPASDADLEGPLKGDLQTLRERINKAVPETGTERVLLKALKEAFSRIVDDPARPDRDSYFFRYRDVGTAGSRWRLVWCWGYQRVDQEAAVSVICTAPECNLLFVRRPGQSPKCPSCEAVQLAQPRRRTPWAAILLLALLLLAGGLAYWYLNRPTLIVKPETLDLIVGEVAQLDVVSPDNGRIEMTSSDEDVVQPAGDNRLHAVAPGTARVEVRQASRRQTIDVAVREAKLNSIAVEPAELVVPVDHTVPVEVVGHFEGGQTVTLESSVISVEKTPDPQYARFNPAALELFGVAPTGPTTPQVLGVAYQGHRAEATVEVTASPFELELSPKGPVELPVGQTTSLDAWANYQDGLRVKLLPDRVQWHTGDGSPGPDFQVQDNRLTAAKADAGPLEVWATYLGQDSNKVTFRTVAAKPLTLRLEVDRPLRVAGEPGRVMLWASGTKGDVELASGLARFESSDDAVVKVDPTAGTFRAMAPGEASITVTHPAAKEPASVRLRVVAPSDARLAFEPNSVRLAVDEVSRLQLYLEANVGEKTERSSLAGPGVHYWIAQPEAATWQPPLLLGRKASAPFEIQAGFTPYLRSPASGKIEVLEAQPPAALRITPQQVNLAPGQTLALTVEEQLPDDAKWIELRPDVVKWEVPPGLEVSDATEVLRPTIALAEGAANTMTLTARYRGRQAMATIEVGKSRLDPADPAVRLVLQREPEGRYLPVGHHQRYSLQLEKGEISEPATGVQWPADYENEFVRWQAPVLTAKRPGITEWLQAMAGGRTLRFYTHTVDPSVPIEGTPPPQDDVPVEVVIESDQGPTVQLPIGAEFGDFRVEARYADGFTRIVTRQSTLTTPESPGESPIAFSDGRILGIRPGKTQAEASFQSVAAKTPLAVEVVADFDFDEIRLTPVSLSILPGETINLTATGYRDGHPVGELSPLAALTWQSDSPQVASVDGPTVTGRQLGRAEVTAQLGTLASSPTIVGVVDSVADPLGLNQNHFRIRVGESLWIGSDIRVLRGRADLSRQAIVSSSLPDVVEYNPETHSLRGISPGMAAVTFSWQDKLATATVEVFSGEVLTGDVVVEPAECVLAAGQAVDLRVFLVSKDGLRVDRTGSAVLTSLSPEAIAIRGQQACALAPGTVEILARLPEAEQPGKARIVVNDEPITQLIVEPAEVHMAVGDRRWLRTLGVAATGTHELFPQDRLAVSVADATDGKPMPVQTTADQRLEALAPGNAEVIVSWEDRLTQKIPVTVVDATLSDLAIEPADAVIHPGQMLVYRVTGVRGGVRRVLTEADGVQLFADSPNVAQPGEGTSVVGVSPGRTQVVAQAGPESAAASLAVTPGDGPGGAVVYTPGETYIYGPGYGYYGSGYDVIYGPGGRIIYDRNDLFVTNPGYSEIFVPPAADAVGLRFLPDVIRMPANSPGSPVRVVEVLADGSLGRDLGTNPDLEFTEPPNVAKIERGSNGPIVRPTSPGETRIAAKLGTLLTKTPLLVQVGDQAVGVAQLNVFPKVLDLWPGETTSFQQISVSPGLGQAPFDVDYRVTAPAGQGVVTVEGDHLLRAGVEGVAQVVVTATDPSGAYNGLTATATVRVGTADHLWIEPASLSIKIGESTPPMVALIGSATGTGHRVPAQLESADSSILAPDAGRPGVFTAKGYGATQVRAVYRNREAIAEVTISGKRFLDVRTSLDEGKQNFTVTVDVLAAASEGKLEYRICATGEKPPENWVPSELTGEHQKVRLRSPPIAYGARTARYSLVLEARSAADGSVERYPFTFRLAPNIERTDRGAIKP